MVCYLHCHEEPLPGREANRMTAFPRWWQGRIGETKRFVSFLVFGESVEVTDFGSFWGQELFLSKEEVFEEGTQVKTEWFVLQLNVVKLYRWVGEAEALVRGPFTTSLLLFA